jgi:hypothetical protein
MLVYELGWSLARYFISYRLLDDRRLCVIFPEVGLHEFMVRDCGKSFAVLRYLRLQVLRFLDKGVRVNSLGGC